MADPATRRPNYSRRIVWLGVFVIVVIGLYTGGWFYVAHVIEIRVRQAIASVSKDGVNADCEKPTARGYPFRIGLYCDRVSYSDPEKGVVVKAGAFRSAGQIYDPMRLVAELDAPASIQVPGAPRIVVGWANLRSSVRLSRPLPERVSVEAKSLTVGTDGRNLISAGSIEGHMRPNGEDLDLASRFSGLALDPQISKDHVLPPMSGDADFSVKNGVALAMSGAKSLRGQSGTIRSITVTFGETGSISLEGPFAIDGDGLVDANFSVMLTQPSEVGKALTNAFPEAGSTIQQGFAGLALLGSQPKLPLRIVKGNASLGFIPLGHVPPIQ